MNTAQSTPLKAYQEPEPQRGTRQWRQWKTRMTVQAIQAGGQQRAAAEAEFMRIYDRAREGRILLPHRVNGLLPWLLEVVDGLEIIEQMDRAPRTRKGVR
jgi:hypothetical protein